MQILARSSDHPVGTICSLFIAWKIVLLLIAASSPGSGYDTSSTLQHMSFETELPLAFRYLLTKLTRWDAIYFVKVGKRGYQFEQEWAWGWGFTRLITLGTTGLTTLGVPHYADLEALVASSIAHISHLFSVLVLFRLSQTLFPGRPTHFYFTAAFLHIISPAGLFLSSPYAESSCAFLSYLGVYIFAQGLEVYGKTSFRHDLCILISGALFGLATSFRSNAIMNGLLLLEEAFRALWRLQYDFSIPSVRHLLATGIGGLFVGAGTILPQYMAYSEYCDVATESVRPWCKRNLPSIYTFVQDHYWNVGLFRYWTLSNLPLFLLATPMFVLLILSGIWALRRGGKPGEFKRSNTSITSENYLSRPDLQVLQNLAISQLILVAITLTTAHVQIITRIASSYPVWVWYICTNLSDADSVRRKWASGYVNFMIVYGIVQAGLFASFLPPA